MSLVIWLAATSLHAQVIEPQSFGVLRNSDVVIIGELHDNKTHHDNQATIATIIQPTALVFEMLSPTQAQAGNGAHWTTQADLDAVLGWSDGGWPDFSMYFPIFEAGRGARIYGAALNNDTVRAAISSGAAAQFEEAAQFGLTGALDQSELEKRETLQAEAHCNALPVDMLGGMVEAQRLRDASFARTTLQALEDTGGPVLVITGNGHARTDWGIPRYLARAAPDVSVLSVGQVLQSPVDGTPPYDRWIVTGAYDPGTGDPCDAFKSN